MVHFDLSREVWNRLPNTEFLYDNDNGYKCLIADNDCVFGISDFGFAQFLCNEVYQSSLRGSPLYMAPEMLINRHYDAKVDLWSVGVIAYECLVGKAPYSSASIKQLHEKIRAQAPIEVEQKITFLSG